MALRVGVLNSTNRLVASRTERKFTISRRENNIIVGSRAFSLETATKIICQTRGNLYWQSRAKPRPFVGEGVETRWQTPYR